MSDFSSATQSQSNFNQSQAFAAALQRAKQIAAKIQPTQQSVGSGSGGGGGGGGGGGHGNGSAGFKRTHDDSDSGPETKRFTSPGSDYGGHNNSNMSTGSGGGGSNSSGPANMSQALAQAAAVAARLAASAGATVEEQVRVPECLVSNFIGRNGNDTINHLQNECNVKIQLSQDQERVLTIRGSREHVTKARDSMQQMADHNGVGTVELVLTINLPPAGPSGYPPYQEIMIPGTKVGLVIGKGGETIKQLQEKTGAKMVIIQEGPNQEVIKPLRISGDPQKIEMAKQLVLELIAQKDMQMPNNNRNPMGGGSNGNGGGNFNNSFGAGGGGGGGVGSGGEQVEVFVPKVAVGVVIGKGGDMIRKIQSECGCKLQFIQGKNDEPGDRRCLIQGTRQQVEDAQRMIDGLIDNVMQRNNRGRNGNGNGNGPMGGDGNNSNYGYGYGVNHAQQPPREEITFMIPSAKCGIVIGRGGETIKLINQQSGAYCEMDRNAVNPPAEKLFKCKGTTEQVEAARQMISEKINMDLTIINRKPIAGNSMPNNQMGGGGYNAGGMSGDPNAAAYQQQWNNYPQQGGWDQTQQQQMGQGAPAAGNQQDYSAQWIEYYKSMGMHREAEAIEQQMKSKQAAGGGSAPGSAPQQPQMGGAQQANQQAAGGAAGGQQGADYSAQWAEYYRSIGKIEEAEAIEKQMKQGNASSGSTNNPAQPGAAAGGNNNAAAGAGGQPAGYPPGGMTPSQYAQYSQYYAAMVAGNYGQPAYGGYGAPGGPAAPPGAGYPGAPQPQGGGNNKPNKSD